MTASRRLTRIRVSISAFVLAFALPSLLVAGETPLDSAMYTEPMLKSPGEASAFAPELKSLWLDALGQPNADLQRQSADAIAAAHKLGLAGLEESVPLLIKLIEGTETQSLAKLSAARALVALDAKSAAGAFEAQLATADGELAAVIEPALAKWNPAGLTDAWLKRLANPESRRGPLLLAIRGLRSSADEQAAKPLREIAINSSADSSLRLESARSLGAIQSTGLEDDARRLAGVKTARGVIDRLAAASMLAKHTSDAALATLSELANDPEPAVIVAALGSMHEQKSSLAFPIAEKSISHADSGVRAISARILAATPTEQRLLMLAVRLDDENSTIRGDVRKSLESIAADEKLGSTVREIIPGALAHKSWRPQEQGALLAGALDLESTADKLVTLLDSPRPEVFVAAAWALRKLSVPSTADAMNGKLMREGTKILAQRRGNAPAPPEEKDPQISSRVVRRAKDEQFSQLMQALGTLKHASAETVLSACVRPNAAIGFETRSAAIWALGHIHAGKTDSKYAEQMAQRLNDVDGNVPEDNRVRRMSAISLGRMKSQAGMAALRRFQNEPTVVGAACVWALREITGENVPDPKPLRVVRTGWFLEPISAPGDAGQGAAAVAPVGN
ncbi:MAG: HEAT repeat domain-containing protein [Planctomycetaceae bacterium]